MATRWLAVCGMWAYALSGCVAELEASHAAEDPAVVASIEALFADSAFTVWPDTGGGIHRIRVCFARAARVACDATAGCTFATRQRILRDALTTHWDLASNLELFDFGMCDAGGGTDNPNDALIVDNLAGGGCQAGISPYGFRTNSYPPSSVRNTRFVVSFCSDAADDVGADRFAYGRWAGIVVHEVGHALGFIHEQNRDENFDAQNRPRWCFDGANTNAVGTPLTAAYDRWSVMQYCTNNIAGWDGGPVMYGRTTATSFGDREGAQTLYGISTRAAGLRAQAAVIHRLAM